MSLYGGGGGDTVAKAAPYALAAAGFAVGGPVGAAAGFAVGSAFASDSAGKEATRKGSRELIKAYQAEMDRYKMIRDDTAIGRQIIKRVAVGGDPNNGELAQLDAADQRTLDDQAEQQRAALAGSGLRGNGRAVAASFDALTRGRERLVSNMKDRQIGAANTLNAVNLEAESRVVGARLNRNATRAQREGAQAQISANTNSQIAGALMGAATAGAGGGAGAAGGAGGFGQLFSMLGSAQKAQTATPTAAGGIGTQSPPPAARSSSGMAGMTGSERLGSARL